MYGAKEEDVFFGVGGDGGDVGVEGTGEGTVEQLGDGEGAADDGEQDFDLLLAGFFGFVETGLHQFGGGFGYVESFFAFGNEQVEFLAGWYASSCGER